MHGDMFFKTIVVAGVSDGGNESELVDVIVNWFCSSEYEARLPLAITSNGNVGGVNQFLVNVGVELDRPILQLTFVDDLWLIDTLRRSYGVTGNPWSFLEKVRIAAGGMCRNDLLHTLPILSKVGILCFVFLLL